MSPPARVVWIEIIASFFVRHQRVSPPARVVWIEISQPCRRARRNYKSPPARVVWIEIVLIGEAMNIEESPPARVVWIEIPPYAQILPQVRVATREGGVD